MGLLYPTDVGVQPGLGATTELVVNEGDTAEALRSGDVPMLATPRVVALAEEATVAALAGHLDDSETTVGQRVQLDHLLPIPVGRTVRAEAKLESCEGRRLVFTVSVTSDRGLVAAGKIHRVIVNRDRFLEKANE
ncbi:MAG: thioesterase [Acidimicrobiia bacterium]|nr:thioesterase [Acidimicrobiia bacterium]MBV9285367.1 thioesterase [Acidimicrobiia bacterium]